MNALTKRIQHWLGTRIPPRWSIRSDKAVRTLKRIKHGRRLFPCDVRTESHIPNYSTTHYGEDRTGTIAYNFNSAGFRSEELDPNAEYRICLLGESAAVGVGVEFEQTVGQRFKSYLADALGKSPSSVNLVNLAVDGASADYCVRMFLRQLDIIQPHLVLTFLPFMDRIEFYDQNLIANYIFSAIDLDKLEDAPDSVLGFCDLYTPSLGKANLSKNFLMLQTICSLQGIEHLSTSRFLYPPDFRHPIARTFFDYLDLKRLVLHSHVDDALDLAVDDMHIGPLTHDILAIALLERFANVLIAEGKTEWGEAISGHVGTQQDANPNWKPAHDTEHW